MFHSASETKMELTAEDLFNAQNDLRAALAAIPPLRLMHFEVHYVREDYTQHIARPINSNVKYLLVFVLRYEGSTHFQFYITDTGIAFAPWVHQRFLTHPIRVAAQNWFHATQAKKMRQVAKARMAPIKEELMAAAWAPARVAKLVAAGAWDLLE